MKTTLTNRLALGLVAVGLLAGLAPASDIEFLYRPGPTSMIIPQDDFRSFHAELINTSGAADSYTLTIDRDHPETWTFFVCYGGLCYADDNTSYQVPAEGTLGVDEAMEVTFDVTSLFAAGSGVYTITLTSNNDPTQTRTIVYDASTPHDDDYAMLFSAGHGVIGTTVNNFVGFHPVLYNAGQQPDSYTITMVRDHPENWSSTFCYDGLCYPDTAVTRRVPEAPGSTMASGAAMPIDIDFTTLFDEGPGSVAVTLQSNTDPSLVGRATYTVTTGSIVAVADTPGAIVADAVAVPNPFNPRTDIRFQLGGERNRDAIIAIVDAAGNRVRTLRAANLAPGQQRVAWDGRTDTGRAAPAGVYLAQVRVGTASQTVKMSLVK
jgi:hypothetical protein